MRVDKKSWGLLPIYPSAKMGTCLWWVVGASGATFQTHVCTSWTACVELPQTYRNYEEYIPRRSCSTQYSAYRYRRIVVLRGYRKTCAEPLTIKVNIYFLFSHITSLQRTSLQRSLQRMNLVRTADGGSLKVHTSFLSHNSAACIGSAPFVNQPNGAGAYRKPESQRTHYPPRCPPPPAIQSCNLQTLRHVNPIPLHWEDHTTPPPAKEKKLSCAYTLCVISRLL